MLKVCKLCTDNCLECLTPGSYCRQCLYPMSLDATTHRCLTCCPSNLTTDSCCQCPSSWDGKRLVVLYQSIFVFFKGLCLHPLVTPSTHSSNWWLKSPIEEIRAKFTDLERSKQQLVLVVLITIMFLSITCLIIIFIRLFLPYRRQSRPQHNNTGYVPLENLDDNERAISSHQIEET